ncbi:MAG: M23 family metallopeptidase [Myxococcota bacterium]|nr:M23 family metallopeptidase [Myxococcota bacterium]
MSLGAGVARGVPVLAPGVMGRAQGILAPLPDALCPPGTLPDEGTCVRLPDEEGADPDDSPEPAASPNGHHEKGSGRWVVYDQIPRRPDRPEDYDAYRYPVPCDHGCVVSGYDLDRPEERQRRGRRLSHVGHGAVDLPQPKGTPVTMVALEHQLGEADVIYVGPLFGTTLITRHPVQEGGQLHDYLILFGHLDATAPGVHPGARVKDGDVVGFVGDTGSPELVHLHLETRRIRAGVDAAGLPPSAMIANENSVVCDPRNVLPRKLQK